MTLYVNAVHPSSDHQLTPPGLRSRGVDGGICSQAGSRTIEAHGENILYSCAVTDPSDIVVFVSCLTGVDLSFSTSNYRHFICTSLKKLFEFEQLFNTSGVVLTRVQ